MELRCDVFCTKSDDLVNRPVSDTFYFLLELIKDVQYTSKGKKLRERSISNLDLNPSMEKSVVNIPLSSNLDTITKFQTTKKLPN